MEEDIYVHLYSKKGKHGKGEKEYNIYKIIIIIALIVIAIASIVIYISNKNLERDKQNAERLKKEANNIENKKKEEEEQNKQKENEKDNQSGNTGDANKPTEETEKDKPVINTNTKKYPVKRADAESKILDIYSKKEKVAYLTFDDGPSSNITPKVLDVLKEEGVKATFFVLGQNVKTHPEQLKRIYEEGHYIANHSYTHKYSKIYASVDELLEEFNDTEAEIKKVLRK